jgi:hypothetical protein
MNKYLRFIFLSLSIALMTPFACKAETPGIIDSIHKNSKAFKYLGQGLYYIGRDRVIDALNGIYKAADNLVKYGVTLHFGPHEIIPQIGFCTTGIIASACGLGVITHTALQNDQKDTKPKYLAGASMLGLGIASLAVSSLFSTKK